MLVALREQFCGGAAAEGDGAGSPAADAVLAVLEVLARCGRFDLAASFFGKDDIAAATAIFDKLAAGGLDVGVIRQSYMA